MLQVKWDEVKVIRLCCTDPNSISVCFSSTKLLHSKTLEGMRKWHLGKHSAWGLCSCSDWHPQHSLHARWGRMSILAFFWHRQVTWHEGNACGDATRAGKHLFPACCCHKKVKMYLWTLYPLEKGKGRQCHSNLNVWKNSRDKTTIPSFFLQLQSKSYFMVSWTWKDNKDGHGCNTWQSRTY